MLLTQGSGGDWYIVDYFGDRVSGPFENYLDAPRRLNALQLQNRLLLRLFGVTRDV